MFSLQFARYLAAVAVALVIVAILAVVAVAILRGGISMTAPSVVGLIGFVATLVGLLANLLQTQAVASAVNGHLQQHVEEAEARGAASAKAEGGQ